MNYTWLIFLSLIIFFSACSGTRHLKPGEVLYTGAIVKVNPDTTDRVKAQRDLRKKLETLTRPRPNKSILGIRYKLFFYNLAGETKKQKGMRYWLRKKLGEPPVLLSQVNVHANVNVLRSHLISKGYLQATGDGITKVKGKTGKALYTFNTKDQYSINHIVFPIIDTSYEITRIIQEQNSNSLIKSGNPYDLDIFKAERLRIDNVLKEQGYFYFSPNYILLQIDSTIGNNKVDIYFQVKNDAPYEALKPYSIRNINIYPNYTLDKDSVIRQTDPVIHKDFIIHDPYKTYKPRLFDKLIFFSKNEKYNRRDHELSLSRLVNIGVFKYVKAEFTPIDTIKSDLMDVDFVLTSLKRKSISAQVTGTTKSNNFIGSEVKINFLNRNAYQGAEHLNLSVSGGFEKQVSGQAQKVNSYSLGAEAKLVFPRFVLPIYDFKTYNAFVPKTQVVLGTQLLNRALYYTLLSGKFEFGYNWKGSALNEHVLNPVWISYIKTANTTDSFDRMLQRVPTLRKNFENQFIAGTNYTFTYSDQFKEEKKNNILFIGAAETAGNLVSAFLKEDADGKKRFLNTTVNQYIRLETDLRNYWKLRPGKFVWANRLNIGAGFPYGNSETLPYVRQFFAGGSSDIRAFRARSLGPGTFNVNANEIQLFADQGGDVKLLLSSELRAKLFGVIHGAVFADAGNIWLSKEDPERPGGTFNMKNVMDEMAVGGGVGIRVDANIFVVRFDLAIPFRKPYLPKGQRWVISDMDFGNSNWRRENIILNIGIGYPF